MASPIEREVSAELKRIRAREEIIPFLGQLLSAEEAIFRPLPAEMRQIIEGSSDFSALRPGSPSTWLQLEGDDAHGAVVVYRAHNGCYYILSPDR